MDNLIPFKIGDKVININGTTGEIVSVDMRFGHPLYEVKYNKPEDKIPKKIVVERFNDSDKFQMANNVIHAYLKKVE